jgi:5-methylcytosine-specific restriction enzyme subunit McrC
MYLYENENIPKALESYVREEKKLFEFFEQSFNGIRPKNYCGFLSLNGEEKFIIPKIVTDDTHNLDIFIYMLMYAYDVKLSNEVLVGFRTQQHKIFEVFIRMFADGLLEEFKRGVFRQYMTMQENLKVLRGKYMFERNFQNFYHQNLHCEYDEFSMDNTLNRFFLYAIRYFKRFSNYPNLSRCEQILDEVDHFNVDIRRLNIRFDRMNKRYEKSFEVAKMLLERLVPLTSAADRKSFAFLFDMAEVFEKFTGRLYQEIDPTTRLQMQRNFGSLQLKPDIVTDTMIIDTKYKLVANREKLATQDKYQMFAYGVNFKQSHVMLLYPKHHVDVVDDLVLGKGEDRVYLKMRSLDLGGKFVGGYDAYVDVMRKRVEELR